MMESPQAVHLEELDTLRPAALDPAVWSANLDALAAGQPAFARALRQTALPEHWRPAFALDGTLTFRVEPPGAPAAWLGSTAAPRRRAAARLQAFDLTDRNVALPTSAACGELDYLLAHLPPHGAVYIFEHDLPTLAATLRVIDLHTALTAGRCLLIAPHEEQAELLRLLENEPGLLPPASILLPDLVPRERMDALRSLCEHAHTAMDARRTARLAELHATLPAIPRATTPRPAFVALTARSAAHHWAAELAAAARELGWDALATVQDSPRRAHPLAHAEALTSFEPAMALCIDHPRPALPLPPGDHTCVWFHTAAHVPAQLPVDDTQYLAASPAVATALAQAGVRSDAIHAWYWAAAARECAAPAPPAETSATSRVVLLVGDLPAPTAEAHGVRQPTHQRLWEQLRLVVERWWETPRILRPEQVLAQAARESGVSIKDPGLRAAFVRLVARAVVPAAVLERIAAVVRNAGFEIAAHGAGWKRLTAGNLRVLGDDLVVPPATADVRPCACVHATFEDPLTPTLPAAAARGWPLVVLDLGGQTLAAGLGGVLRASQHFAAFTDTSGLRRALESIGAARDRTEAAREHVRGAHTWALRLQAWAARLSAAPQEE